MHNDFENFLADIIYAVITGDNTDIALFVVFFSSFEMAISYPGDHLVCTEVFNLCYPFSVSNCCKLKIEVEII